jgi:hypothetical protein
MPSVSFCADDLSLTKLVLQLEPKSHPRNCNPLGDFVCDDNHSTGSNLNVSGSPHTPYNLYLIAADINTHVGLQSVSLELDQQANLQMDWQSCAAQETYFGDWPTANSGISLSFGTCAGTTPDPSDPEGDGSVILGSMYVYAYSTGTLSIKTPATAAVPPVVVDCQGDSTQLNRNGPDWLVSLGMVGFGVSGVVPACEFDGAVDDYCAAGWSNWMYACCRSDSTCGQGLSQVSKRACEFAGGVWRLVRCSVACYGNLCGSVPVAPLTWGRLKSKYE